MKMTCSYFCFYKHNRKATDCARQNREPVSTLQHLKLPQDTCWAVQPNSRRVGSRRFKRTYNSSWRVKLPEVTTIIQNVERQ